MAKDSNHIVLKTGRATYADGSAMPESEEARVLERWNREVSRILLKKLRDTRADPAYEAALAKLAPR